MRADAGPKGVHPPAHPVSAEREAFVATYMRHSLAGPASGTSVAELLVRYPALTQSQRAVYREMLVCLRAGRDTFDVQEPCRSEDVFAALSALEYDHPELFWVTGAAKLTTMTCGASVRRTIALTTEYPLDQVPGLKRRIDRVTRGFAETLPRNASSYEKVRAAYEFVIRNTSYDDDAAHDQSMAAALLDHRAVCAGYAKAFCHLLRSVDVPCGCVQGMASSGGVSGPHLWNIVRIDGVYTHVDVTWGVREASRDAGRERAGGISYGYLCVTTDEVLRSRTMGEGQVLPRCTSRAYDWFGRRGLLLDTFSAGSFDGLLARAAAQSARELAVKFANQDAFDQCVRWMGTQEIFSGAFGAYVRQTARTRTGLLSWSRDDELRIVTVRW